MEVTVRRLCPGDLPAIAAVQAASPEAAQWNPGDYLDHLSFVAICNSTVAGFLVTRTVADGEHEILNIAVAPEFRRCGVAKRMISEQKVLLFGDIFLEVRESNEAARNLYKSLGFQEVATRPGYYCDTREAAIVMKFHSCYCGG